MLFFLGSQDLKKVVCGRLADIGDDWNLLPINWTYSPLLIYMSWVVRWPLYSLSEWGVPYCRYGGHLRPYLSVTCDPTPLNHITRSLATLPLFTAQAIRNKTWSLATLPTPTRENTGRSLATLPTQIGRVTSDHLTHPYEGKHWALTPLHLRPYLHR